MVWRELAFCISQLQLTDKGLRVLAEQLRNYKHTLVDAAVFDTLRGIALKARKTTKSELKECMCEWERQLLDGAGKDGAAVLSAEAKEELAAIAEEDAGADTDGDAQAGAEDEAPAPVATTARKGARGVRRAPAVACA